MTKRKPKKQVKRVSMTIDDGLAALFYKLPQNEYDYECAINGIAYRKVLWDLDQELRRVTKYSGDEEATVLVTTAAREWRDRLWELMKEEGIEL